MEPSGVQFVGRFPGSHDPADLAEPFRTNALRFLAALQAAGAAVHISATFRPTKRAYLMHFSFAIARAKIAPASIPPFDPNSVPAHDPNKGPLDIAWVHLDGNGQPDLDASRHAAEAMVQAYGIAFGPAFPTKHSAGTAIDMTITWTGTLNIKDGNGQMVSIASTPRIGSGNAQLHKVGASYGVIKLVADPPHWSDNGH
jgi:D-alanyl-D-alanine dipeptidase